MKKILVVDDSKSMRMMIKTTLESTKEYIVQEAEDGLDALNYLGTTKVDLIISDVNMPNLNGIELTSKIKSGSHLNKDTPILILTTESSDDIKSKGKSAGATGWIVKPFSPDKLLSTILRVL